MRFKNEKENIITLIGNGPLSVRKASEALSFVDGEIHSNFIIIVNDNQQSIVKNQNL